MKRCREGVVKSADHFWRFGQVNAEHLPHILGVELFEPVSPWGGGYRWMDCRD